MAATRTQIRKHIGTHIASNVIGYLALFIALSGTAYAAGLANNTVKSKHIKNGQVKAVDTNADQVQARVGQACTPGQSIRLIARDGSVTCEADDHGAGGPPTGPASGDLIGTYPNPLVGPNTVASNEVTDNTLTATDLGPGSVTSSEIASNSVNADDLGDIINRSVNYVVPSQVSGTYDAACLPGEELLGGGGGFEAPGSDNNQKIHILGSQRVGVSHKWRITVFQYTGSNQTLRVDAICLV